MKNCFENRLKALGCTKLSKKRVARGKTNHILRGPPVKEKAFLVRSATNLSCKQALVSPLVMPCLHASHTHVCSHKAGHTYSCVLRRSYPHVESDATRFPLLGGHNTFRNLCQTVGRWDTMTMESSAYFAMLCISVVGGNPFPLQCDPSTPITTQHQSPWRCHYWCKVVLQCCASCPTCFSSVQSIY